MRWITIAAAVVFLAGCYNYPAPPAATGGSSFTGRKRDRADELLKGIKVLTLADARRIALENNPDYISASHAIAASQMRLYSARGAFSPTVYAGFSMGNRHSWAGQPTGSSTDSHARSDAFSTSTFVGADWVVFSGLRRWHNLKAAESSLNYYNYMYENTHRELLRRVSIAFNTVLLAIEGRRIAEEDRNFQKSSLDDARHKFAAGSVPRSDVLNFEILHNNAEVNLLRADLVYEEAIFALAVLMGYPEGTLPANIKLDTSFNAEFPTLPAVEIYLDAALANRPDLKGAREEVTIALCKARAICADYMPTLNIFAEYGYNTGRNTFGGPGNHHRPHTEADKANFAYGLSAEWTIFNGLIRANRLKAAKAAVAIAEYTAAAKWFEVVEDVRNAYANYLQSVRQSAISQATRDYSKQQRDLVEDQYRSGNTEITRLNEAQRDLVNAESALAASRITTLNAIAQLDAAVAMEEGMNTRDHIPLPPEEPAATGE